MSEKFNEVLESMTEEDQALLEARKIYYVNNEFKVAANNISPSELVQEHDKLNKVPQNFNIFRK